MTLHSDFLKPDDSIFSSYLPLRRDYRKFSEKRKQYLKIERTLTNDLISKFMFGFVGCYYHNLKATKYNA